VAALSSLSLCNFLYSLDFVSFTWKPQAKGFIGKSRNQCTYDEFSQGWWIHCERESAMGLYFQSFVLV
ncbi:unnamed protein product, partial [Citrullus colocynthis]